MKLSVRLYRPGTEMPKARHRGHHLGEFMLTARRGLNSFLIPAALWSASLVAAVLPAQASTNPNLEIQLAPPSRWSTQDLVEVSGTVTLHHAVDALRLTYEGEDSLALAPFEENITGPWERGDQFEFSVGAHAAETGRGRLVITAEGLDELGRRVSLSRTFLYALVEEEGVWTSISSWTDLRAHRASSLFEQGTISEQERDELLIEIITAATETDHQPRVDHQLNAHERWLSQASPIEKRADQPLSNLPATATISTNIIGVVRWKDSAGGVHGVPFVRVEILKPLPTGVVRVGFITTEADGSYKLSVQHDDSITDKLFARAFSDSELAGVLPITPPILYHADSVTVDAIDGLTFELNITAANTGDAGRSFGILHAVTVSAIYAGRVALAIPGKIDIVFPVGGTSSEFDGTRIHILSGDAFDWDVINHEYGHYFAEIHRFSGQAGGTHKLDEHFSVRLGKPKGVLLAWNEGWANYFGIRSQLESRAISLGIPNVGDRFYQDTVDQSVQLDLESCRKNIIGESDFIDVCVGEDNEASVATFLFDLTDKSNEADDRVSLTDRSLFAALTRSPRPLTVGDLWENLAAENPNLRTITDIGSTLGQAAIAPELLFPFDNLALTRDAPPPTFEWLEGGGGVPNPLNDFNIAFYDQEFTRKIFFKSLGGVDSFTPSAAEFATILAEAGPVRWVVEGRNLTSPVTPSATANPPESNLGFYWSGFRTLTPPKTAMIIDDTGSMNEEIAGVRAALESFIDRVETTSSPGEEPPTLSLLTFKDVVTPRISSNDLSAVRSAVGSLVASGGGDCPEFSAQALAAAVDTVGPGGTILLATDAASQPGINLGGLITTLRARGVSVNVVLSGDCEDIDSTSLGLEGTARLQRSGFQTRDLSFQGEGDTSDDGGDPTDVPSLPPLDSHGDSPETASLLFLEGEPALGILEGEVGDQDFFRFELEAGKTYRLDFSLQSSNRLTFSLLNSELNLLESRDLFDLVPGFFLVTPAEGGTFFLRVSGTTFIDPTPYIVTIREDAFGILDSAVDMFSTIAQQTGGVFLVRDGVNSGQAQEYEAALFNILLSSIQPAILASNPDKLPRSAVLAVELNGRGTNWQESSVVSFTGDGIQILSTEIRSATSLTAIVEIDATATIGFRDVEVITPLGDEVETSFGRDVIEITAAETAPTLLSIEPNTLERGKTTTVLVRGLNALWDASSTVNLGNSIAILSTTVLAEDLLEARVTVSDSAPLGFRTASVATTGFGTQNKSRALFVSSGITAIPEILSVAPEQGSTGESLAVTITARNTEFEAGVTSADFGTDIEILDVEVLSPEETRVSVVISPDAEIGFRDISLITGEEIAVRLNGFFVLEGDQDQDDDGVADDIDLCSDTLVPESVPSVRLGFLRWALVDGDDQFDTRTFGSRPSILNFSLLQTRGCSCEQIIERLNLSQSHRKFGCSTAAMFLWKLTVNH